MERTHGEAFDAAEEPNVLATYLVCPVCLDMVLPPIFMCKNGHNICSRCKPTVQSCPTCRSKISGIRNILAENVTTKLKIPCQFKLYGCEESIQHDHLKEHEECCAYKLVECLAGMGVDYVQKCGWKGSQSELLEHVKTHEDNNIYKLSLPHIYPVYHGLNMNENYRQIILICKNSQLFWLFVKYDCKSQKIYEVLQCLAPQKEARRYQSEHMFHTEGGDQKIVFLNDALSDTDNADTAFETGKCVVLNRTMLNNYFDQKLHIMKGYTLSIIADYS